MFLKTIASIVLSISATTEAVSGSRPGQAIPKFPVNPRVVHQYSDPTWVENIAVRANGNILATQTVYTPNLYEISNPESSSPESKVLHTFPAGPLLGITEVKPDVFILVEVEYAEIAVPVPNTAKVWEVDFNTKGAPRISNIANTTEIAFPNGITSLPGNNGVLISDSLKGLVWRFDVETRNYEIVMDYPELKSANGSSLNYTIGINGIHLFEKYAYWTDSLIATIYRLAIDMKTGKALPGAKVEKVTSAKSPFLDDFIIDSHGGLYAASADGTIVFAPAGHKNMTVVAGAPNTLPYAGPTAFAFGRNHGKVNESVLYVTTNGGLVAPINGNVTEGGKVIALYP